MKVRDIITNENLLTSIGSSLLGKAASKGAKAVTPYMAGKAAKAAKQAQFVQDIKFIGGAAAGFWNTIKNFAIAVGIVEPMIETALEIRKLNNQLKANEITPADYEKYVQGVLGACVTKIAAIGLTAATVKTIGRLIGTLPFAGGIGKAISATGGTVGAGLGVYLMTPAGHKDFAQWFAGESFAPWLATFMRDWVGSWTKQAYDGLTGHEDARGPVQGSATGNSVSDALKDIPQTGNPMGMKFDSGTGNWINRDN